MNDIRVSLIIPYLGMATIFIIGVIFFGQSDRQISQLIEERNQAVKIHTQQDESILELSNELDKWRTETILCWRLQDENCKGLEDER
jgi:hypothetical protein